MFLRFNNSFSFSTVLFFLFVCFNSCIRVLRWILQIGPCSLSFLYILCLAPFLIYYFNVLLVLECPRNCFYEQDFWCWPSLCWSNYLSFLLWSNLYLDWPVSHFFSSTNLGAWLIFLFFFLQISYSLTYCFLYSELSFSFFELSYVRWISCDSGTP